MSHVDEGTLHAMLDGELPGAEVRAVEKHLAGCAQCRALLAEAGDFFDEAGALVETLDEVGVGSGDSPIVSVTTPGTSPGNPASHGHRHAWWRRPQNLAWAATIVLAVGAGYLGVTLRERSRQLTDAVAAATPSPRSSTQAEADQPAAVDQPGQRIGPDTATVPAGAFAGAAPEESVARQDAAAAKDRLAPSTDNPPAERSLAQPEIRSELEQRPTTDAAQPNPVGDQEEPVGREPRRTEAAGQVAKAAKRVAVAGNANEVDDDAARGLVAEDLARDSGAAGRRRDAVSPAPSPQPADERLVGGASEVISLDDAISTLGGSIRLIDGRQPVRVERREAPARYRDRVAGDLIRVIYQDDHDREFVLEQIRISPPGKQQAQAPLAFSTNDTVLSRESDGAVRIRWVDRGGFLLALIGRDEAFLRRMMGQVE